MSQKIEEIGLEGANQPDSDRSQEAKITATDRRAYLVRQLSARGVLSLARYNSYSTVSSSSLKADIKHLYDLGWSIHTVEIEGRIYIVDAASRHLHARFHRSEINAEGKESVAIACCSMLLGVPDKGKVDDKGARELFEKSNPELDGLLSRTVFLNQLFEQNGFEGDELKPVRDAIINDILLPPLAATPDQEASKKILGNKYLGARLGGVAENVVRLKGLLMDLWDEARLSIFLAAGTTNERFARWVSEVLLPTGYSKLANLEVSTNSRTIFNIVGDPEVPALALVIGGSQVGVEGVSESIAGPLSDVFMDATSGLLNFQISFVGAVALNVAGGFAITDSLEERRMKESCLSSNRSRLRVLCIDRSKIKLKPVRSGHRFATLSPKHIDLIITNKLPEGSSDENEEEAELCIRKIRREYKVPVFEAEFDHSRNDKRKVTAWGREFRIRTKYQQSEELFMILFKDQNEQDNNDGKNKDEPAEPRFPNKAMEVWMQIINEWFLSDKIPDSIKQELVKAFNNKHEPTYYGNGDFDPWRILKKSERKSQSNQLSAADQEYDERRRTSFKELNDAISSYLGES